MGQRVVVPPLVEPIPIHTEFVSGIVVEEVGEDAFMFTGFLIRRAAVDDNLEREVKIRAIMTKAAIHKALCDTAKAIGIAVSPDMGADGHRVVRNH